MKVRARRIWEVGIMHSLNIYRALQILCVLMEFVCLVYNVVLTMLMRFYILPLAWRRKKNRLGFSAIAESQPRCCNTYYNHASK